MNAHKTKGSISIFLCLSFIIILSLIMCTIEMTHISTMKTYTDGMSHIVLESEFGYYSIPLAENYGILGIPMTDSQAITVMNQYIEKNINTKTEFEESYDTLYNIHSYEIASTEFTHLTDCDGEVFFRQVMDYMQYASATYSLNYLLSTPSIESFAKDYVDISSIDIDDYEVDETFPLDEFANDTADVENIDVDEAQKTRDSIFTKIKELITNASLTIYIKDQNNISSSSLDTSELPSQTLQSGSNLGFHVSAAEKLLYLLYLSNMFSSYTDTADEPKTLAYQLEYILNGDTDDDQNLLSSIMKIQALRTGLNLAYLYSDSSRRLEARTLAQAAVGLIQIPFIVEFTQLAILSAWAYAEAILDIRSLLAGQKISLYKTKATWTLELEDLLVFDQTKSAIPTENGFTYEQYLMIFLYKDFDSDTLYRTMDLIESDMQKNYDSGFQLKHCVTGLTATFCYDYQPIFFLPDFLYQKNTIFSHETVQHYTY